MNTYKTQRTTPVHKSGFHAFNIQVMYVNL